MADSQQPQYGQMLPRLRHDPLVRSDDEHDRIDARCAGHHLPYEALMPRDVDDADDPVVRKDQRRKPKLDGNAPFLFLFEAVAIHPRERLDERRLSVIDMPRRAEDERNFLLRHAVTSLKERIRENGLSSLRPLQGASGRETPRRHPALRQ